jgi:hypothetical protein
MREGQNQDAVGQAEYIRDHSLLRPVQMRMNHTGTAPGEVAYVGRIMP